MRLTKSDREWAEDITQETMLRALASEREGRGGRSLKTWLYTVARNVWLDVLRREVVRRKVASRHPVESVPSQAVPVERTAMLTEEVELRLSDLDQLPDRQRSVLYLAACEELDNHEIASVLNISPQAVKASLCVARQRIRKSQEVSTPK